MPMSEWIDTALHGIVAALLLLGGYRIGRRVGYESGWLDGRDELLTEQAEARQELADKMRERAESLPRRDGYGRWLQAGGGKRA